MSAFREPTSDELDALLGSVELSEEKKCKFASWLAFLPEEKRQSVIKFIELETVNKPVPNYARIHRQLSPLVDIGKDTIRYHIQGRCACR
jgi:hypothetical protein